MAGQVSPAWGHRGEGPLGVLGGSFPAKARGRARARTTKPSERPLGSLAYLTMTWIWGWVGEGEEKGERKVPWEAQAALPVSFPGSPCTRPYGQVRRARALGALQRGGTAAASGAGPARMHPGLGPSPLCPRGT